MKVIFSGATDVGKVRDHNEDAFAIIPERNLVFVCDGMGGHAAGEVASSIAVETISDMLVDSDLNLFADTTFPYPEPITPEGKLLVGAIAVANQRIVERGSQTPGHTGMGTTVVACHFSGGIVSICHVGDSRAYLVRDRSIKRVTIDHSWVSEVMEKHNLSEEESENLVNRNVITRALGTKPAIRTDISQIRIRENDLFLLCSDGLCGMVGDGDILKAMLAGENDLDAVVRDLIQRANDAGGADNITVCVAKVLEQEEIDDFEEVRRVTVDWSGEAETKAVKNIASARPSAGKSPAHEAVSDTLGAVSTPAKKKRILSSRFLITILLLVAVAVVVIWYLQSR